MNDTEAMPSARADAETAEPEFDHKALLLQFEEAFDETREERELSERDRDYYDNDQLTEEELAALEKRGQPAVVSNRIGPKIDALLGHEKRMRTDPKAYPRTPKHEADAESVTDAVRFVCDQNRFSAIRSEVAENVFIEGAGAVTITVKVRQTKNGPDFDVVLTLVPWDRFYRDPKSRKRDFSDASFLGVVLWMDEDIALQRYKGAEDVIASCYDDQSSTGDTYDDKPVISWADRTRKRVRILQHRWLHKGVWHTATLCRGGFLRKPQVSPYVDEHGEPQCDLRATSAYVNRKNQRYGVARRHISAQDEINKRRSKALHLLNNKTVIAEKGAVKDVAQARREVAKPDGYIEVNGQMRFEIEKQTDLVAGQLELLREAKSEIDASGVNPALEGDARAPSGRAQEMLTLAGLAEMAKPFEAIKDWSWEVYRQVWYRIRQFWTQEKWIRVTDDEDNLRWVGLNKPVTLRDQLQQRAERGEQVPEIDPNDPRLDTVVGVQNQLSELDVDLLLEDGPDSITIQGEQFEELVKLKTADPTSIPTSAIIEASSLRNKKQILEKLESGGVPPQVQQQMQQQGQQIAELTEKLKQALADKDIERVKLSIDAYKAMTDRLKLGIPPGPSPMQDEPPAQPPQIEPPQGGFFMGEGSMTPQ